MHIFEQGNNQVESITPVKPSIETTSNVSNIRPVEEDQKVGVLNQIDSIRSEINDGHRSLSQAHSQLSESNNVGSSLTMTVTQPTPLTGDDVRIIDGDINEDLYIQDGEKVQINGNVNANIFMANDANVHIKGNFTGDAYMNSNNNFVVDGDTEAFIAVNYQNNIAFNGEFTAAKNNYQGGMSMSAKKDNGQNVRFEIKANKEHGAGVYLNSSNNASFKKDIKSHIRANKNNKIEGENLQGSAMLNEENSLSLKSVTGNMKVNINNQVAIKENYTKEDTQQGITKGTMKSQNGYVANNENGYTAGGFSHGSSTPEERQVRQQEMRSALMSIGFSEAEIADLKSQEDSANAELQSIENIIKQKLSEKSSDEESSVATETQEEQPQRTTEEAPVQEENNTENEGNTVTVTQTQNTQDSINAGGEEANQTTKTVEPAESNEATSAALRSAIISSSGNN